MLSLYILAAVIIPGVLFLIYCFIGLSRAQHDKGRHRAANARDEHKRNHRPGKTSKVVLAAFALVIPATLAALTTQAAQPNSTDLQQQVNPNPGAGKRFGARVALQYGQATENVQGGTQNELCPQVYCNLWQAYGTYVARVGSGLTVDFGKWAGALGVEGNYTKDQINYSRSYFFNYLPFYHMGFQASYDLNDHVAITGWLVNGAQQTEDFNCFKSVAALLTIKPVKTLSWNVNYYTGQKQRVVIANYNPGLPTGPTQPGLPTQNISLLRIDESTSSIPMPHGMQFRS